ncbi:MAG TPA: NAD(P)-dependent oxidoreductase [Thauera sp.]|nr:NAD(P)-dependent oxidoreductase [Thauera sp.]
MKVGNLKVGSRTVGFIGLGVMGEPMARHLRAACHDLAVWARRPESAAALVAEGVPVCATPAELAARSEVVITIVTSSADVEALAFGKNGLADGFVRGAVHVDMSTIAPAMARSLAQRYATRGIGFVDAPVSGGGQGARDASLAIMAGAEADILASVRPLLEAMGKRIVHVGPPGAGQVAKACNQMIMVAAVQACAEAVRLANAHGVDVAAVRSALMGGSAASRVLEVMGAKMVERDFAAGIEARLHHKDFAILLDEASRLGTPLPIAAQVGQQLNALMGAGWGRDDTSSLLRVLER